MKNGPFRDQSLHGRSLHEYWQISILQHFLHPIPEGYALGPFSGVEGRSEGRGSCAQGKGVGLSHYRSFKFAFNVSQCSLYPFFGGEVSISEERGKKV